MSKESFKCSALEKSLCVDDGDCQWSPFTAYEDAAVYELNANLSFGTMDKYNLCETRHANLTSQASYSAWYDSATLQPEIFYGNCSLGQTKIAQISYKAKCGAINAVDSTNRYYIGFLNPASVTIDPNSGWPLSINSSDYSAPLVQECLMANCAVQKFRSPYFDPLGYAGCGMNQRVLADLRYPDRHDRGLVDAWAVCGSSYRQWNRAECETAEHAWQTGFNFHGN